MQKSLAIGIIIVLAGAIGVVGMGAQESVLARAQLKNSSGENVGMVIFAQAASGTQVTLRLKGLTIGKHGAHIHAVGQCNDTTDTNGNTVKFGGAGGHFDPLSTAKHGNLLQTEKEAHAGDLGNVVVDANGNAEARVFVNKLTVASGPLSVVGKAVIIHAGEDDEKTSPAGNSGARVYCGIIGAM